MPRTTSRYNFFIRVNSFLASAALFTTTPLKRNKTCNTVEKVASLWIGWSFIFFHFFNLTHSVQMLPSYRNQSIDLHSKSVDWFLYEGNASGGKKCQFFRKFCVLTKWMSPFLFRHKIFDSNSLAKNSAFCLKKISAQTG